MNGLDAYLERNDIDADREIEQLSREAAKERAVETAYYKACVSDPTYHGVNHGGKVDVVANVVKRWPQFTADDFAEIDRAVDRLIDERSA